MKEHIITITERPVFTGTIRIMAESKEEALRYAEELYDNGELCLSCYEPPVVEIHPDENDAKTPLSTYYTNDKSKYERF